MQHKRTPVVDFSEKQKSTVTQRCDSRQLDARKSLPMRRPRTEIDSKLARTAQHCADADCVASASIAELLWRSVDAVNSQEQSQGSKPQICGVGISILDRHVFYSTLRGYRPLPMFLLMHSQISKSAHPGDERPGAEADQAGGLVRNDSRPGVVPFVVAATI